MSTVSNIGSRRRVLAAVTAALAVGALLAGCSNDELAKQYTSGVDKNYIAAASGVTEVKAADRGKPIHFSGTTQDSSTFSSASALGQVLVVNFWYAGCPPCRAEASDLTKIAGERFMHDPRERRCSLSSITSFERREGQFVEVGYADPASALAADSTDVGAV